MLVGKRKGEEEEGGIFSPVFKSLSLQLG